MEIKLAKRPTKGRKKKYIPRPMPLNEMRYKTSWTVANLSSGTTGIIASVAAPTIANSSEYSTVASLFTEVRLIRATLVIAPVQSSASGPMHSYLEVGTNMIMNATTFTTPTAFSSVQNTTKKRTYSSASTKIMYYKMAVPPNLEFANIAADAPATVTPWAGSPGAILLYGEGFTNSDAYFRLSFQDVVYHLRGRQ
jgi:hypothetical protein